MMTLILMAVLAFSATNVDDLMVLLALFADPAMRPGQIFAGQLLGTWLLTLLAIAVGTSASSVAGSWAHLLGVLPLGIGLHRLVTPRNGDHSPPEAADGAMSKVSLVTVVTVANGGDNLAAYVPVMIGRSATETTVVAAVWGALTIAWCFAALLIMRHAPQVRTALAFAPRFVPWIYVGLGVYILAA